MGEPLGDSATRRKAGGGLVLGDGGGSSNPSSTSTNSSGLPAWAQGYAKDTLADAANLTNINKNPYKTYDQPRIAGFSPMQEQAQTAASNMSAGPEAFQKNMSSYMSPYMQNVVDVQKQEAARQSGIMGTQQQAQATQAGAFGGSRDAIMRAERERNLGQQMNQIQAQGSQAAYDQAANQFRQGITQDTAINQLQNQYGNQQQQQAQRGLDTGYQDFLNQQNYPYKQLGFMSDMIRGLPLGQQSTQSMYQAPPSMAQNVGAIGMGAYGVGQLMGKAEGGQVNSYADGGEINPMNDPNAMTAAVDKLTDEQLKQIVQNPTSAAELQAAQLELATRASERGGLAGAYNMAQGGVVAFDDGGPVGSYAPGDPVTYQQALRDSLAYNAALSKFQPAKGRTREEQEADAKAYFKQAQELGGPDPYADYEKTLKGFEDEDANMLSEGKGLGALQAAAAMLQGNDPARAIGNALGTFGTSYGQTLKESRARKRASAEGQFQLASERRKERMGLGKEALAREAELAKAIREGDKERVEVLLKQASAAAQLAAAAKPQRPTGGGGGAKGTDAAALAIYAELRAKGVPEVQARAQAYREAIALSKTSDVGPTKASLTEAGLENAATKDFATAWAKREKELGYSPQYLSLAKDPEAQKRFMADAKASLARDFKRAERTGAAGATPAPAGGGTRLKFDANGNLIQ
jgi:hypothetical protein